MKKHQIGFIASALAFPVITCTLYLSMGAMLKGNNWKSEKDVFPIFGKFNNGRNKPVSQKTVIPCENITLKNDHNYAEFIDDDLPHETASILLDTSDYLVSKTAGDASFSIEPKNEFSVKLFNRLPMLTLINCTYYLNNRNFIPAEKTQFNLIRSSVSFIGEDLEKKHPDIKVLPTGLINTEVSDSSEITIKNTAVSFNWNITLKNHSSLNIQANDSNIPMGKYQIQYDESCTINMPASLLKYCTLLKEKN